MPRNRNSTSQLVVLVAFSLAVAALYLAKEILLPIALAVLLSFLLTPLANRLERWGLPRIPATLVVTGFSFAVLVAILWTMAVQAIDLGTNLPRYQDQMFAKIRSISGESARFSRFTTFLEDLSKQLTTDTKFLPVQPDYTTSTIVPEPREPEESNALTAALPTAEDDPALATGEPEGESQAAKDEPEAVEVTVVEKPLTQVRNWVGPLLSPLSSAGLVAVLVLFLLLDREDQRNRFIQLFGVSNFHATTEAMRDASRRVMRFLRMQFLINACYGLLSAIALSVLGVPNAIMWGVLGFMLRFLPYIGPIVAAALPIIVSAAVSPGWTMPLLVAGWYVTSELLLNNLVEPWLYGNSIGVSAVGIIFAAIFWTWIWGPIGLVLAMPLTVCLVVLANYVPQLRFVSVLLGDQQALSPAERTYQRFLAMDDLEIGSLARKHVNKETLADYYDNVLLPALYRIERDRHEKQLSEEQETFARETVADLVDELGTKSKDKTEVDADSTVSKPASNVDTPVLCIPLRDRADQATTWMLAQLLQAEGLSADVTSVNSLTNEIVEEVEARGSQIVVISILPPCSPRNSRLLYRRLRERFPNLAIITGYWNELQREQARERFGLAESDRLVTTLQEAAAEVRKAAAKISTTSADDTPSGSVPPPHRLASPVHSS